MSADAQNAEIVALLTQVLDRLGGIDARLDGMNTRLETMDGRLKRVEHLCVEIAKRTLSPEECAELGIDPPTMPPGQASPRLSAAR